MKFKLYLDYCYFVEEFEVDIFNRLLNIELINILPKLPNNVCKDKTSNKNFVFNLSLNSKDIYSNFLQEFGDGIIFQNKEGFFFGYKNTDDVVWYFIDKSDFIIFLSKSLEIKNLIGNISTYNTISSDLLINSLFADIIRNDFSSSKINKIIKFIKVSGLAIYINYVLNVKDLNRLILDQTLLGDITDKEIAFSLSYYSASLIKLYKLTSKDIIIFLLNQKGLISLDNKINYDCCIISRPCTSNVRFLNHKIKKNFYLNENENYIFEIGNNSFEIILDGGLLFNDIYGTIFLFNGDYTFHDLLVDEEV